jgi:3-hydroxyisobutyrate dehydrogenase-like beta-hydroxyacid dehydrogenase
MNQSVAVVGLGQMGSAMAARLQEMGVDVMGWDTDPQARARAEEQGLRVAHSAALALADRDVVLTRLPDAAAVRAAPVASAPPRWSRSSTT